MDQPGINVIIPVTKIDLRIKQLVLELKEKYLDQIRICIVLNPSKDVSGEERIFFEKNRVSLLFSAKGLGNALRTAYKQNGNNHLVYLPDDNPFEFQEIDLALCMDWKSFDLLVLTKYSSECELNFRHIQGLIFQKLIKMVFRLPVSDTQCSFIASSKCVSKLSKSTKECRFLITLENILVAFNSEMTIIEVPANWGSKKYFRKSTIRFWDKLQLLVDFLILVRKYFRKRRESEL